jgi:hypothetical protein
MRSRGYLSTAFPNLRLNPTRFGELVTRIGSQVKFIAKTRRRNMLRALGLGSMMIK